MTPITSPAQLCAALDINFSSEQLAAITAPLAPGVIIAGAGTGKTTVMAARVVWLVGTGAVAPDQVLGLTFTRKAASELATRVRSALQRAEVVDPAQDGAGEEVIMTYDAFAGHLVSSFGALIGMDTAPTMITGAQRYRLAERVVGDTAEQLPALRKYKMTTLMDRLLRLDGELQANLVDVETLLTSSAAFGDELDQAPVNRQHKPYVDILRARQRVRERAELARLSVEYQQLKRQYGVIEFGDQLRAAVYLAQQIPRVVASARDTWRVVLLDEYQDTSAAQAQLLHTLFGHGHPVTAVGDPCQAIYGWRGAAANNITGFAHHFATAGGTAAASFQLTVNRRSGQQILDVANEFAEPLRQDPYVADAVHTLVAPADARVGGVEARWWNTWASEVDWVGERIVAAHPSGGGSEIANWSDCAVLCRRNRDVGEVFAALRERDIPVEIVGLSGLLNVPEVAEVVAVARVLIDESANPEVLHLLAGRRWRIGPRDLALLASRARDLAESSNTEMVPSLAEAAADPGAGPYAAPARRRLAQFSQELTRLRANVHRPVAELIGEVIDTIGIEAEVRTVLAAGNRGGAEQLAAFVDAVAQFADVDPEADLAGLLAWLDAERDYGVGLDQAVPSDDDSVKLLTIHRAKGLEWDLVLLPGLVSGTFPSERMTDNWTTRADVLPADLRGDAAGIPQLREVSKPGLDRYGAELKAQHRRSEDRLAYVAVTRARHCVVASGHRWRLGAVRPHDPSGYFDTLKSHASRLGQLHPDPELSEQNPMVGETAQALWPEPVDEYWLTTQRQIAANVLDPPAITGLDLQTQQIADTWHAEVNAQLAHWHQARQRHDQRTVVLPTTLSTSRLLAARKDPAAFAAQLARPMPQPPSQSADLGSRFHSWVERYLGDNQLFAPEDELAHAEEDVDDADFATLTDAFQNGQFATRQPHAVECDVALALTVAGHPQLVRGRIDAVYAEADGSWLVVDWKTHQHGSADDLQLACYRLAWADTQRVDPEQVTSAFYYVRADRLVLAGNQYTREELSAALFPLTAEGERELV